MPFTRDSKRPGKREDPKPREKSFEIQMISQGLAHLGFPARAQLLEGSVAELSVPWDPPLPRPLGFVRNTPMNE